MRLNRKAKNEVKKSKPKIWLNSQDRSSGFCPIMRFNRKIKD